MRNFLVALITVTLISSSAYAETIKATVNGLVCAFCATGITKTFKAQPAVADVKVDLENKLVTINTKSLQDIDDATITKLLTDSGYTVTDIKREK
jgi:mercuric ion binding protein